MNREIKFREWETERKTMAYGKREDFDDMVGFRFAHEEGGERILMQYTGLKDKNGVEIYEWDIVCDQYANNYTPIFRNGTYMAYNVDYLYLTKQEPSTQFNIIWKGGCEVIGNIYENPEFLNVK